MSIKLSEYGGEYVVVNDEVEPRETLLDLLDEGDLEVDADVFTVDNKPVWGHIINAERVWTMVTDQLYEECEDYSECFSGTEEAARTDLKDALNAWAAKHVDGTILVGTRTRIDISELFEEVKL